MATGKNNKCPSFTYMDESSIHRLLFCNICRRPLINPVRAIDGRQMCRQCWIDASLSSTSTVSSDSYETIDEVIILDMLDNILVQCSLCSQTNIRRGDYPTHEQRECRSAHVSCTAADLRCAWSGPRKLLKYHLAECRMEPVRPVLAVAIEQVKEFQRRIVQLEDRLDQQVDRSPFERQLIALMKQCFDNSSINLQAQRITDEHVPLIIEYALRRKTCATLDMNSNQITDQGVAHLADALRTNRHLEKLYLANNHAGDRGAVALAQVLAEQNQTLQVLGLESNGISDDGVTELSNTLRTNRSLTCLSLSANQITDYGLELLVDVLVEYPSTLEEVNLSANQGITDQSFRTLQRLIRSNQSLKKLRLICCSLSDQSKHELQQSADMRTSFQLIFD